MKVKELIGVLENVNPELEVFADGCDCTNEVSGVEVEKYDEERHAVIRVRL